MPPFNMTFSMTENLTPMLHQMALAQKAQLNQIVRKAALDLKAQMILSFKQPKHGLTYQRGSKTHTSSAEGEAPAIDTGVLMSSIQVTNESAYTSTVTVGSEYGAYLEFGTKRMGARPFVVPAINKVAPEFHRQVQHVVGQI